MICFLGYVLIMAICCYVMTRWFDWFQSYEESGLQQKK